MHRLANSLVRHKDHPCVVVCISVLKKNTSPFKGGVGKFWVHAESAQILNAYIAKKPSPSSSVE